MMFQTIMTLANSYEKATSEDQLNAMRDFAEFLGEKTKILPRSGKFDGDGKVKLKRFSQILTFDNVIEPKINFHSKTMILKETGQQYLIIKIL